MDTKTRKIILIGFAIILLVVLASICSDIFLVIAVMSVLTNLLVFAELGHKFWDEFFDVGTSDIAAETNINDRIDALVTDTYPETYIPARNTGHIPYYESPLLEPDEMFPRYYGDVDDASVALARRRIRDEQAINGAINKTPDHYKAHYRSEFADEENKIWYGQFDI